MCLPISRRDRRTRIQLAIANLSLIVGLLVLNFGRSRSTATHEWIDGICGLPFGLSIGINLLVVRRARRRHS